MGLQALVCNLQIMNTLSCLVHHMNFEQDEPSNGSGIPDALCLGTRISAVMRVLPGFVLAKSV